MDLPLVSSARHGKLPALTLLIFALCILINPEKIRAQSSESAQGVDWSGQLWGYFFGDYYYKYSGDAGWGLSEFAGTPEGSYNARLRRIYLGYDFNFSQAWFGRVLLEGNSSDLLDPDSYDLFLKHLYVGRQVEIDGLRSAKVTVGLQTTPYFVVPEEIWGLRAVEKTVLDSRKFGTPMDQGISFSGEFDAPGQGGFNLMVARGAARYWETDSYVETYGSIHREVLPDLTLELFGQYKLMKEDRRRFAVRAFAAWHPGSFVLGASASRAWWSNEAVLAGATEDLTPLAFSVFTSFDPVPGSDFLRLFLRYDHFDPHSDYRDERSYTRPGLGYTESLFIAGARLQVMSNLDLMPNVYVNRYHEREGVTARASDVVPRMTVYLRF